MIKLKKTWSIIILIIASISIATALTAEYIYNILPCKMCVYQRFSYYGLIIISIIYILLKKQKHISYFLLVELLLVLGLFLSLWHVGIENNFIEGPSGCTNSLKNIGNVGDLKEYILHKPIVSCNEINWAFIGISFAIYNSLLQFLLLITNSIFIIKKND